MNRSLDANIVLRAILQDDPVQTPKALDVLREPCVLLPTVLLEVIWVLGSRPDWPRARIIESLDALFELPLFEFRYPDAVRWAVSRYAQGADFADMLHIALSAPGDRFTTFDKGIATFAAGATVQIETL
jgi:predicted nucleic-acid-binding protein